MQLGHHINGLFVLIQEVQNEPLSIGEHPQWMAESCRSPDSRGASGASRVRSFLSSVARPTVRPSFRDRSMAVERETKVSQVLIESRGWDRKSEEAVRRLSAGVRTRLGLHLQCPVRFGHEAPAERLPTPDRRTPKRNPQTPGCHLGSAGIQINLVAVGIRCTCRISTTGPSKPSPRS